MQEVTQSQILGEQPERIIEVSSIEEFDAMVSKKKSLDRLLENEDFKAIILGEYLTEDFIRLSEFLMSANRQAYKDRDMIVEKIAGKGHLKTFLSEMRQGLTGIDNPEERLRLLKDLEEEKSKSEAA